MRTVKLTGWKKGLQKVSLTKIIRKHTGYGLAEGKRCVDDVLENKTVIITNLDDKVCEELLQEVRAVGVIAEIG